MGYRSIPTDLNTVADTFQYYAMRSLTATFLVLYLALQTGTCAAAGGGKTKVRKLPITGRGSKPGEMINSGQNGGDFEDGQGSYYAGIENHAVRLVKTLLDDRYYSKDVKPRHDVEEAVNITVRMNLYQIIDVNEANQNLLLYMWITQIWDDEFLYWDPDDYGGITESVLPVDKVWLPDTQVYNNIDIHERHINVIATVDKNISNTSAQISLLYPAMYKVTCKMNIRLFPYDRQNCTLEFGSWTRDSSSLVYYAEKDTVRFESYVTSEEWDLQSFAIVRQVNSYSCCPHPYTELHAHLVIQRKALYYQVNLVIPSVIITLIAVIGCFTPASSTGERIEKVNLGMTTLLAMAIFLLMVSDQMPRTSSLVPLIGWFFLSIIIIISVATSVTSILIIIQQQGRFGRHIPRYAEILVFKIMGPLLCMRLPHCVRQSLKKGSNCRKNKILEKEQEKEYEPLVCNGPIPDQLIVPTVVPTKPTRKSAFAVQLSRIEQKIETLIDYFESKEKEDTIMMEWEFLTKVLDRFFLLLFVLIIAVVVVMFVMCGSFAEICSHN